MTELAALSMPDNTPEVTAIGRNKEKVDDVAVDPSSSVIVACRADDPARYYVQSLR